MQWDQHVPYNSAFRRVDGRLFCDEVPLDEIARSVGTPVYVYSQKRLLHNYKRIHETFTPLNARIHYSAKANANLDVLRVLIAAGAGIDAVSAGEIDRALRAGADPKSIVFAGVGKTEVELHFALECGVGWISVENEAEAQCIDAMACEMKTTARVALRLNPDVSARTHPSIATGHGGSKFGLSVEAATALLKRRSELAHLDIAGIHVHIGSQLRDVEATAQAVKAARTLADTFPFIHTIDVGGGMPVNYGGEPDLPTPAQFAAALRPLLEGYTVIVEPGRAIAADAGVLLARVLYVKENSAKRYLIVDAGMTELMRPMLYGARHAIVPISLAEAQGFHAVTVAGPVCETTDTLAEEILLPSVKPGDVLAILTCGAYGMVMANNYNARPRPPEVVVLENGTEWKISRRRETWDDLVRLESG
ncbi:MAG: diaminopimelate decarboxylase [Aggregatilineales bacterium]